MRFEGKERHDLKHGICEEELAIGSIVLLHNTRHKKDMPRKLSFKWLESFKIFDAVKDKGTYILKELDRSRLAGTFAGERLVRFHSYKQLHLDHAPDLNLEERPTLDDFLTSNSDSNLSDAPDNFFGFRTISLFFFFLPMYLSDY